MGQMSRESAGGPAITGELLGGSCPVFLDRPRPGLTLSLAGGASLHYVVFVGE
jgi:hypothetical protein